MSHPRVFRLLVLLAVLLARDVCAQTVVTAPEGRFGPERPEAPTPNAEAKAQAVRLVAVLHMTRGLQSSIEAEVERSREKIEAQSAALPPQDRARVLEVFDRVQTQEAQGVLASVTGWFATYYARALTPAEMQDLIAFYQGELGAKMIAAPGSLTAEERRVVGAYVLAHRAMSKAMTAMGDGARAAAPYIRSERAGFSEDVSQSFCQEIKGLKLSARFRCVGARSG